MPVHWNPAVCFRTIPYRDSLPLTDLSRKRERERLPVRREPHWQRLGHGAFLGFRRGPDTWLVRFRSRDRKQLYTSLGEALDFDEAMEAAKKWLATLAGSGVRSLTRSTVRAALEAYLADLRRHGRHQTALEAEGRFKSVVYDDALADLQLESATREDFQDWRERIRAGRQARTVNRHVRSVVAGLNRAIEVGYVGNPMAWRLRALADDVDDGGETAVFLDPAQRKAIIAAASPFAALFFRGLELTGARPRELAAALVVDFDGQTVRLSHRKGRPPKLRIRQVVLSAPAVELFKRQARDKLQSEYLFTEDGETPWRRHIWAREMRAAISKCNENARGKARISADASAYSFRHARISELLQVYHIDPLTVAAQTGTSLAMIEKAYLRFIPSALQEKLAALDTPKTDPNA
jgi:integrase